MPRPLKKAISWETASSTVPVSGQVLVGVAEDLAVGRGPGVGHSEGVLGAQHPLLQGRREGDDLPHAAGLEDRTLLLLDL